MSESSITQTLLTNNSRWRQTYSAPVTMAQLRQNTHTQAPFVVLTCMDPRCDPSKFLNTPLPFATLRNAGGRVTPDALRGILTLRSLNLGAEPGTVLVVQHTDCGIGMGDTYLTSASIKADIARRTPREAERAQTMDFKCWAEGELEKGIREDVEMLRAEGLVDGMDIVGLAFDVETGEVRVVC